MYSEMKIYKKAVSDNQLSCLRDIAFSVQHDEDRAD